MTRLFSALVLVCGLASCGWFLDSRSVDESSESSSLQLVWASVPPNPDPEGPFETMIFLLVTRSGMELQFRPYSGRFDGRLTQLSCAVDGREVQLDLTDYVSERSAEFDLGTAAVPFVRCQGVEGSLDTGVGFAIGWPDSTIDAFSGRAGGGLAGETFFGQTSVLDTDELNLTGGVVFDMISGCWSADCDSSVGA